MKTSHSPSRSRSRALLTTALIAAMSFGLPAVSAAPALAFAAPQSFADLVQQVSPAVVNITTSTKISMPTGPGPMFPDGSPFSDLFRDFGIPGIPGMPGGPQVEPGIPGLPGFPGGPQSQESQALGSGFVISEDGYIVTNNHVIEGADAIEIEFFAGTKLPAKVVGTDPKTDIALLKVESPTPLAFVKFGNSDLMRVGDWVLALGNPLGQGFSASSGIISARNRELEGTYDDYLQTDAAINRGNSGGPLFNMNGEVIGVNTAILSPNGGSIGIGFSMASTVVQKVVQQLKDFGETRRGWLGVKIQDVTPDMAEALGMEAPKGAMVTDVPQGPAAEAGMKAGDVITSFAGGEVANSRDLVRRVADAPVGQAVDVVVLREGKTQNLKITLGRRELAEAGEGGASTVPSAPSTTEQTVLGMSLAPLTAESAAELSLPSDAQGLVVHSVDSEGAAYDKGLRAGDVITEAGQQPVTSLADLQARIAEAKEAGRKSLLMMVRRAGEPRFVALPIE